MPYVLLRLIKNTCNTSSDAHLYITVAFSVLDDVVYYYYPNRSTYKKATSYVGFYNYLQLFLSREPITPITECKMKAKFVL